MLLPHSITHMESLVDSFIKSSPAKASVHINASLGPIFDSAYDIENLKYEEMIHLPWLLTRELKGPINSDNFKFWSWCFHILYYCSIDYGVNGERWTRDTPIVDSFGGVIDLSIFPSLYSSMRQQLPVLVQELMWNAYPLLNQPVYSILEGILRRKNKKFMDIDGTVHTTFLYPPDCRINKRMNSIKDSLTLFENHVCNNLGPNCDALQRLKTEIIYLINISEDPYTQIQEWRNELLHGQDFWHNKGATIMNMNCLLILDALGPNEYDSNSEKFRIMAQKKRTENPGLTDIEIYMKTR